MNVKLKPGLIVTGPVLYVMDVVDRIIYKMCPFVAGGIFIGSVYWTAVTYGAVTVMQVFMKSFRKFALWSLHAHWRIHVGNPLMVCMNLLVVSVGSLRLFTIKHWSSNQGCIYSAFVQILSGLSRREDNVYYWMSLLKLGLRDQMGLPVYWDMAKPIRCITLWFSVPIFLPIFCDCRRCCRKCTEWF